MSYQLSESEFRSALGVIEKIGEHVDDDLVSQYHKDTSKYGSDNLSVVHQWEDFLINELRHILGRIALKKHLDRKHGIEVKVRGIDTVIDWASFHSPWNQRLSVTSGYAETDILIKGIKPHYDWLFLTEGQYNRSLSDDRLISGAKVSFEGWGRGDFTIPGIDGVNTLEMKSASPQKSRKEKREKPHHIDELKEKFETTEDYGEYTVYKLGKERDWIINHNSPIKVTIAGLAKVDLFDKHTETDHHENFEADYSLQTNALENTNKYLP